VLVRRVREIGNVNYGDVSALRNGLGSAVGKL
jgi:hypothetical protein